MTFKTIIHVAFAAMAIILINSSCKKSKPEGFKDPVASGNVFWHGYITGTNSVPGPGNAILLRPNGTMREYANDYFSSGTHMNAADTAAAATKLDGTFTISGSGVVVCSWIQPNGSPVLTYSINTVINGDVMTGTITSVGTGISSTGNIWLTDTQ